MQWWVHFAAVAIALLLCRCDADVYMQNPRGSNNRLAEENNARANPRRLFDSQNNARGGYNVGSLSYFGDSLLQVEWTAQHSTVGNVQSAIIIQYMCEEDSPGLRDGTTTKTIPDDPELSNKIEYGQHETYTYYRKCKSRERNLGLFTADQLNPADKKRRSAIYTRQNNAGTRYGFECPEERDYYPYWHPSPWKDLAILTSDISLCDYYQSESENVKGKQECEFFQYNNEEDCTRVNGTWFTRPAHGIPPPTCTAACYSRDNHLGNTIGGYPCIFNLTLPDINSEKCVMRIRYNMSSTDYNAWEVNVNNNTKPAGTHPLIAARYPSGSPSTLRWTNNPKVDIGIGVQLQMNLNTNQLFRVFQDRSHTFSLRKREITGTSVETIHNLNVRGKRGNIVQVFPAVEYDFVPNVLVAYKGQYVHIQWTGSNTNDRNNDGEGKRGTDRSNFVQIKHLGMNFPLPADKNTMFDDPEFVRKLALLDTPQLGGSTQTLDDAGTYFNGGIVKLEKPGVYHYMSTRNNNFSNRSQKGTIIVLDTESPERAAANAQQATIITAVVGSTLAVGFVIGIIVVAVLVVSSGGIAAALTKFAFWKKKKTVSARKTRKSVATSAV